MRILFSFTEIEKHLFLPFIIAIKESSENFLIRLFDYIHFPF